MISNDFLKFSKALGDDFDLVQGAGGNTSLKTADTLFVKASGFKLSEALDHDIFAQVKRVSNPLSSSFKSENGKRPSIETSFHMMMPQPCVAHVHAVHVMALSMMTTGKDILQNLLHGFEWVWVDYHRPGLPLATAISDAVKGETPDVVVLANHGLIVAGKSPKAVKAKISDIAARAKTKTREMSTDISQVCRSLTISDLNRSAPQNYTAAKHPYAHILAFDKTARDYATEGSLYPDHVVFLERGAIGLKPSEAVPDAPRSKLLIIEGVGAFVHKDASEAAHDMSGALGRVASLIPPGADVNYLSPDQETELLEWEAEKHRQALAKAR